MAKKRAASVEYLQDLVQAKEQAQIQLTLAKARLYLVTGEGKLFEAEFENAREECLQKTETINRIIKEIGRVERELISPPELPFED